jgi:hypothetical protein
MELYWDRFCKNKGGDATREQTRNAARSISILYKHAVGAMAFIYESKLDDWMPRFYTDDKEFTCYQFPPSSGVAWHAAWKDHNLAKKEICALLSNLHPHLTEAAIGTQLEDLTGALLVQPISSATKDSGTSNTSDSQPTPFSDLVNETSEIRKIQIKLTWYKKDFPNSTLRSLLDENMRYIEPGRGTKRTSHSDAGEGSNVGARAHEGDGSGSKKRKDV